MTSSWFFLSTLNYDARSTTHQSETGLSPSPIFFYKFELSVSVLFSARSRICEWRLLSSSSQSVPPSAWDNSANTGGIFVKFDLWVFFEKKNSNSIKIGQELRILYRHNYTTFTILSFWFLLRVRNCWVKRHREIEKHILYSIKFFVFWKLRHVWDNVEKYGTAGVATDGNIIRAMRFFFAG